MSEVVSPAPELDLRLLGREGLEALEDMARRVRAEGWPWLEVHLASLPRKFGRNTVFSGRATGASAVIDASRWRSCDVAAAVLLREAGEGPGEETGWLRRLYDQGDAEERRMILRSLPLLPETEEAADLIEEAHRTNDEDIFAAGVLDSDLPARILPEEAWRRIVLKAAFLGIPLDRLPGYEQRGSAELSGMLLDFRTERQAAGRKPWAWSLEVAALAPSPGVVECVLGDLWHGDALRRAVAARAAARLMADDRIRTAVRLRLTHENLPAIRELLSRLPAPGAR